MERLVSAKSPRQRCAWYVGLTAGRSVCQQGQWASGGAQGRDEARKESETKLHIQVTVRTSDFTPNSRSHWTLDSFLPTEDMTDLQDYSEENTQQKGKGKTREMRQEAVTTVRFKRQQFRGE